jgi:tetratricopeptide (TPR) repeat protein
MFDPEALLARGREARRENRLEEARDLVAQAVAECRFMKDPPLLARALKALGQAERDLKHTSTALQCYREAVAIYRDRGDKLAKAHGIRHIADILREQKAGAEAEKAYDKALAIYRAHPETPPLDLANTLRGFALLKEGAGDGEEAVLLWYQALDLYSRAGVQAGVAECQSNIAFLMGR